MKKNVLIRRKADGGYSWEAFYFRPKALFAFAHIIGGQEFKSKVTCKKDMEQSLKDLGIKA